MHGLMMDYPLTLTHILERSAKLFPYQQIASKIARMACTAILTPISTAASTGWRTSLAALGVQPGDRVGTLCWNRFRHLELYFAIPCYGAVMHTLNLRLALGPVGLHHQSRRRSSHLRRRLAGYSLLEPIRDQIPCVKEFVILPDDG